MNTDKFCEAYRNLDRLAVPGALGCLGKTAWLRLVVIALADKPTATHEIVIDDADLSAETARLMAAHPNLHVCCTHKAIAQGDHDRSCKMREADGSPCVAGVAAA